MTCILFNQSLCLRELCKFSPQVAKAQTKSTSMLSLSVLLGHCQCTKLLIQFGAVCTTPVLFAAATGGCVLCFQSVYTKADPALLQSRVQPSGGMNPAAPGASACFLL
jgi:hypothetical protein